MKDTESMITKKLVDEQWGTEKLPKGGVVTEAATSKLFKTGDWRVYKPIVDHDNCTGCTKCYFVCPDDAIRMDDKYHPVFDLDFCKGCKLCADVCPTEAITMELEEK